MQYIWYLFTPVNLKTCNTWNCCSQEHLGSCLCVWKFLIKEIIKCDVRYGYFKPLLNWIYRTITASCNICRYRDIKLHVQNRRFWPYRLPKNAFHVYCDGLCNYIITIIYSTVGIACIWKGSAKLSSVHHLLNLKTHHKPIPRQVQENSAKSWITLMKKKLTSSASALKIVTWISTTVL